MGGNEDRTELNRTFFNEEAANYDAKHEKASAEIVRRIEARRSLIGVDWVEDDSGDEEDDRTDGQPTKSVRLLDYACGTGAMTRALAPYTTQCIGIDLSENMVDAYNARARNQGLSEDEVLAYHGNLCVPGDEDPEAFRDAKFYGFDVACVGLGFHHFDDPALAAKRLATRLRPGGVLVIIDFLVFDLPDEGHGEGGAHPDHHQHGEDQVKRAVQTVTHHGFTEEIIKEIYTAAGVGGGFVVERMGQVTMGPRHGNRELFLARGTKA